MTHDFPGTPMYSSMHGGALYRQMDTSQPLRVQGILNETLRAKR